MQLLDGRATSKQVLAEIEQDVARLKAQHDAVPGLALVLVGDDPASQLYVRKKADKAASIGVRAEPHVLPGDTPQQQLLDLLAQLNDDPRVHGILVQFPPPPQISPRAVIEAIRPEKDVDCFHPYSIGKLAMGDEDGFVPCAAQGAMELLKRHSIDTGGKHAAIVGPTDMMGKPIAMLLAREQAACTVTICRPDTAALAHICRQADILVVDAASPEFITADMVKDGAAVIDAGANYVPDSTKKSGYRTVGDVDFDAVAPKTSHITPVPGGVGPMIIAMLLRNVVTACRKQNAVS